MERAPTSARTAGGCASVCSGSAAITTIAVTKASARRREPSGPERAWTHGSTIAGQESATGVPGVEPDQIKELTILDGPAAGFVGPWLTKYGSRATNWTGRRRRLLGLEEGDRIRVDPILVGGAQAVRCALDRGRGDPEGGRRETPNTPRNPNACRPRHPAGHKATRTNSGLGRD